MTNTAKPSEMLAGLTAQNAADERALVGALDALAGLADEARADPERFVACRISNLAGLCRSAVEAADRCAGRAQAIQMLSALARAEKE